MASSNKPVDSRPSEPPGAEKIPPLTNIAPCIFTPLTEDITKPLDKPLDREGRLRRIIKTIDVQNVTVRDNLIWMLDRERQRIIQEAQAHEAAAGIPDTRPDLPPEAVDEIIACMMAPADPRIDYNLPELQRPAPSQLPPPSPNATIRERALHEIMLLVERSVDQLLGYENFMTGIRNEFLGRLEAELERFGNAHSEERDARDQPMVDVAPR